MINLPTNVDLGRLLNTAHARALPTVTLCHVPAVFLATCLEGTGQKECAYTGYKTMCFTDKTDAFTPSVGYLPGPMPWKVEEAIAAKGSGGAQQIRDWGRDVGPRAYYGRQPERSQQPRHPGGSALGQVRRGPRAVMLSCHVFSLCWARARARGRNVCVGTRGDNPYAVRPRSTHY